MTISPFRFINLIIIAALLLISVSCTKQEDQVSISIRKVKVVATVGMITDIVENVGRERVDVIGLMGSGVDPHQYKASARDLGRMFDADIIFYGGLHLEGKMAELFEKMQKRGKTAVAVTEGIDRAKLLKPVQFEGADDPHVWFDVTLWMDAVKTIRNSLCEIDPNSSRIYEKNTDEYLAELAELHAFVLEQAQRIPEEQRVLITAHDAFNYFGRAYGFEVKGLQGISTAAEAGTGDLRDLAEFIVERKIKAIFIESSIPVRSVEAVKAAVQSRGFDVTIGGQLYSDAMGSKGTEDGTYIGMVKHNINIIVGALLEENKVK